MELTTEDIVRDWKDPDSRTGRRAGLAPDHPAGEIALDQAVGGNASSEYVATLGCCPSTIDWCTYPGFCPTINGTCDLVSFGCCP
jgi:mersacidin/lichenicidin family type 2 lantibiotic